MAAGAGSQGKTPENEGKGQGMAQMFQMMNMPPPRNRASGLILHS